MKRTFKLSSLAVIVLYFGEMKPLEEFVFLIPSYNNARWYEINLNSVVKQKFTQPFRILYVNDCSTDATGSLVDSYVKKNRLEGLIKVIHNTKRMGALANIYNTIHNHCKDHEVVAILDGDDLLEDENVLLRLEKEYSNPNIWITYGKLRFWPSGKASSHRGIPQEVLENKKLRQYLTHKMLPLHLQTFRVKLFKRIKKEDLIDSEGKFFPMTYDQAIMLPMLEMAAPITKNAENHSKFITDILYKYNDRNPISDGRVNSNLQHAIERLIRSKKPYDPVESLEYTS